MISYLLSTNADWVVAVVRTTLGIVMFAHGAQKLLGWFGGAGFNATMDVFTVQMKLPSAIAALAIWAKFFGGLGLIVGLLSRVAAFGIAATMLAAIVANAAIAGLRPRARDVVEILRLQEHSLKETGEILGISTAAVKTADISREGSPASNATSAECYQFRSS
jgi:uncharacterized membrane protein YphA (DoxX/SURF4 family)